MNKFLESKEIKESFDKELKETQLSIDNLQRNKMKTGTFDDLKKKRDEVKTFIDNTETSRLTLANSLDPVALSSSFSLIIDKAKVKNAQEPLNLPFQWISAVYFKTFNYTFKAAKNFIKKEKGADFKQKVVNSNVSYMTAEEINLTKEFVKKANESIEASTGLIQVEIKKLSQIASKTIEILDNSNKLAELNKQISIENSKFQDHDNIIKGFEAKQKALEKKKDAYFKVKALFQEFLEIVLLYF